ncbi:hypothetical protein DSCW_36320 [Desulfosarcina widdelii]|uniref:ABM domain-containing protein n=1 Tax=Desulfosarcina widdelii TaxID=947919 RepID=A0A5K7Z680_9BACT|nr:antibiotic biosynthesis monooxygenase family protein [Desulfosarcina widdelii]BBO76215.1 hypothetical protein DSCW_36320 [Desulfosarcina widdelii]
MIIILARINVRPEKRRELRLTFQAIVEQLRKERGCLRANFYQAAENENEFLVVEEWATHKDTNDHLASDLITVLIGAGSLMVRPPEIMIHTVNNSKKFGSDYQ